MIIFVVDCHLHSRGRAIFLSLYFVNVAPAYGRCSDADIKAGTCAYPGSEQNSVTPGMLKECSGLGIRPEKCSETEILKHRCIGYCGAQAQERPLLDPVVAEILAGSGAAFVASIVGVKKLRGLKKKPDN